jgi:hypothetical protein
MLVRYQAEDKPQVVQATRTRGVSSLLQGSKSALIPQNSERMARRELNVLTNAELSDPAPANGHHGHNGHACCGNGAEELVPLRSL